MKTILLFLLLPLFSFAQQKVETKQLSGYFIVMCFKPGDTCSCGLNIPSTEVVSADSMKKETCLCDGNYYKDFSLIYFVPEKDLDLGKIDDFGYQVKLQKYEQLVFLSTNKNILYDNYAKDSSLVKDSFLVNEIQSDTVTANKIEKIIAGENLNFDRKIEYNVLLKGTVSVLQLKDRPESKDYKTPLGYKQYVFLNNPENNFEFVKVIKDPF